MGNGPSRTTCRWRAPHTMSDREIGFRHRVPDRVECPHARTLGISSPRRGSRDRAARVADRPDPAEAGSKAVSTDHGHVERHSNPATARRGSARWSSTALSSMGSSSRRSSANLWRPGGQPDRWEAALPYPVAGLAALPRAEVVDRYSAVFKPASRVRPARSPTGSLRCRSAGRTFRWCSARPGSWRRNGPTGSRLRPTRGPSPTTRPCTASATGTTVLDAAPDVPAPSTADVRAWARTTGLTVPDRAGSDPRSGDARQAAHHS